jgi:hypothetical protein
MHTIIVGAGSIGLPMARIRSEQAPFRAEAVGTVLPALGFLAA